MEAKNVQMKNCHLKFEDGGIQMSAEVEGQELSFNRYIGTRGACVASNAEDTATDTFSGGPFTINLSLTAHEGRWVARVEVRHDPKPFRKVA